MTNHTAFSLLVALADAQTKVRELSSHRCDALQTAQAAEDRLAEIATDNAVVVEEAFQQFAAAHERWQSAGQIDPADAQDMVLRAMQAFAASVEAGSELIAVARTVVGAAAQAAAIADSEIEARAQQILLELQIGATTTTLTAQA